MHPAMHLFYIGLGGAVGACSRYLLNEWAHAVFGRGFPYGTLLVNILGSFIMGLLIAALEQGYFSHLPWRPLIGLGLLGALTTFSTFSADNLLLLQQGEWLKMGLNMALNVGLCLLATWAGFSLVMRG